MVASGGALTLVFYTAGSSLLKTELEERGRTMAAGLARENRYAVLTEDAATLKERTHDALEMKDVLYVAVVVRGAVLAAASQPGSNALPLLEKDAFRSSESGRRFTTASSLEFFDFVAPIVHTREVAALEAGHGGEDLLFLESESAPTDAAPATSPEIVQLGEIHVGVSGRSYGRSLLAIIQRSVFAWAVVSALGLLLLFLAVRQLLKPLRQMSDVAVAIADGDLRRSVKARTRDEVGRLAYALDRMTVNLRATIDKVAGAAESLDQAADRISGDSGHIGLGSEEQLVRTEETSASILEMDGSIREVAQSSDSMARSVVETIASVEEMTQSIRRINENVTALLAASEDASASILQMNANINEVSESADELSALVTESVSSIEQILESIGGVEANTRTLAEAARETRETIASSATQARTVEAVSVRTRDTMDAMARDAGLGQEAVQRTSEGMERIREVFDRTAHGIQALGARSEQIGAIVTLIEEIAERTNLLALNAAIIAAKAGARGKGFAVVADEIRELSSRTSLATRDISRLVDTVRSDVSEAVSSVAQGADAVLLGVELSRRAADALQQISAGAETARSLAKEIAGGTGQQLRLGEGISQAMQRTESLVHETFKAIEMQSMESREIRSAVENMMDKATHVKKATVEQRTGGEQITRAMERVSAMIDEISRATSEQSRNSGLIIESATSIRKLTEEVRRATSEQTEGSRQVVNAVEQIHSITRQNAQRALELKSSVSALLAESEILRGQIATFQR